MNNIENSNNNLSNHNNHHHHYLSHQLSTATTNSYNSGLITNGSLTGAYNTGTTVSSASASIGAMTTSSSPASNSATVNRNYSGSEKRKIGHHEIKNGVVHYKKVSTDELKKSIQFGIVHFINEQSRNAIERDLLQQDFQVVETITYLKAGSAITPAHSFNDFKLKVYAPYGFKYLRRKFGVNELDFMVRV